MTPASHISAPNVPDTVAPFRAWRGSQLIVARGPTRATIEIAYVCIIMGLGEESQPEITAKAYCNRSKKQGFYGIDTTCMKCEQISKNISFNYEIFTI